MITFRMHIKLTLETQCASHTVHYIIRDEHNIIIVNRYIICDFVLALHFNSDLSSAVYYYYYYYYYYDIV